MATTINTHTFFMVQPCGPQGWLVETDRRGNLLGRLSRPQPTEVPAEPIGVNIQVPGPLLDIAWTLPMTPLVTEEVKAVIEEVTPGSVQWIPATILGHPGTRYFLNLLQEVMVDDLTPHPEVDTRSDEDFLPDLCVRRRDLPVEHHIFQINKNGGPVGLPWAMMTATLRKALAPFSGLAYKQAI